MRLKSSRWIVGLAFTAAVSVVLSAPLSAQTSQLKKAGPSRSEQLQAALKTCFACHGTSGVSVVPSRPTIAGQKPEYLRRQLLAFKQAEQALPKTDKSDIPPRPDPIMGHMAANLPNDLISPVAAALSTLPCDGGKPRPENARTYDMPDAGKPCVDCHGADGIGRKANVPNLAGQQRSYLRRQLLLLRETAWGAQPRKGEAWRTHPIMEAQAARLSITNIDALARYYNALPCRGEKPAPSPKTK